MMSEPLYAHPENFIPDYERYKYLLIKKAGSSISSVTDVEGQQHLLNQSFRSVNDAIAWWKDYEVCHHAPEIIILRKIKLPPCAREPRDEHCSYWCVLHEMCQWYDE